MHNNCSDDTTFWTCLTFHALRLLLEHCFFFPFENVKSALLLFTAYKQMFAHVEGACWSIVLNCKNAKHSPKNKLHTFLCVTSHLFLE